MEEKIVNCDSCRKELPEGKLYAGPGLEFNIGHSFYCWDCRKELIPDEPEEEEE